MKESNHYVSILGDSYSTFEGCLPDGNYVYYPREGIEDVRTSQDTWWHRLLTRRGLKLLINDSSSGTTVSTRVREKHNISDAFVNRMKRSLSSGGVNGQLPGTILIFGGTNDSWINNEVGSPKYDGWTEEDLLQVLPAYCYMLHYVLENNPQAKVVCIINCDLKEEIQSGIADICAHYDVLSIQLHDISKITGHPDNLGMQQICDQVDAAL